MLHAETVENGEWLSQSIAIPGHQEYFGQNLKIYLFNISTLKWLYKSTWSERERFLKRNS